MWPNEAFTLTDSTICGESCTTVTPGSVEIVLVAARFSVTVIVVLFVWVGSDTPAEMPENVSQVITEALRLTVITSAVLVPSTQKLAATTPRVGLPAACTVAVLVITTTSGLAA